MAVKVLTIVVLSPDDDTIVRAITASHLLFRNKHYNICNIDRKQPFF